MKYFIFILYFTLLTLINTEKIKEDEKIIMNLYYSKTSGKYVTKISSSIDKDALASATYVNSYQSKGWDFLTISSYDKPDNKYDDSIKSYGMGYLEGVLNKDRIFSVYRNLMYFSFYDEDNKFPENLIQYLTKNLKYMKEKSLKYMDEDPYWEHVYYIYNQMLGMFDGYNSVAENEKKIDLIYFQMVVANADIEDAVYYNNMAKRPNFKNMTLEEIRTYTALHTHCSALVKVANDLSDVWIGHNTWTTYGTMIRTFKEYRFVSNKRNEKSKVVVFSSYPGSLSSVDDFYYLDSNLVVMETTNSNFNDTLYDLLKPESLLTWVRVMIANRLASSGREWIDLFKRENSGTYNNQFQVLDLNKIDTNKKEIKEEAFMIIEQLPEYTESGDVTHFLTKGYWPSYNIPYFKTIYEKSGYVEIIENNPSSFDSYDYSGSDRPVIFRREQTNVNSLEDFKKMMRYNHYQEDECSQKNAAWTIASRYDLNVNGVGRPLCYGAIDVKFVSVKEITEGKNIVHIISGPTNDDQPTFSWSNTTCHESNPIRWFHEDVVDTWNFPWIDYEVQLFDN